MEQPKKAMEDVEGFERFLQDKIYGNRVVAIRGNPEDFFVDLDNSFFIHLNIKSGVLNFGCVEVFPDDHRETIN